MSKSMKMEIIRMEKKRTEKIDFLLDLFDQIIIILERDWTGLAKELIVVSKNNFI